MGTMDCHSELERTSRDVEVPETTSGQSSCQGRLSIKLEDRFRLDGHKPSYADFHPEVVRNVDDGAQKSKGFQQEPQAQRKVDEVVRYMSNLPSYLERGEKHKDKTFNVGVLEWRHLEKWQYNQRQVPRQSCRSSPSSSNTSSFSSTEGSSFYSSMGHSCSPARQRTHHTMLDSNLNVSSSKVYSHGIKTAVKNGLKSHDLVDIPSNYLKLQQSILRTHQCFNKYTGNKPKGCKSNDLDLQSAPDKRRLQEPENRSVASSSKGKLKVQGGEDLEKKEKLQGPKNNHADGHSINKKQTMIILLPKDGQEVRYPAYPNKYHSAGKHDQEAIETSRQSFVDESNCMVNELSSGIPHSCPLTCEADAVSQSQTEQCSSIGTRSIKFLSEMSKSLPYSGRSSVSPVMGKSLEEKKSIKKLNSSTEVLKPRTDIESNCKVNEHSSDIPRSFPLSCESDAVSQPQNHTEKPSSAGAKRIKFPSLLSQSIPYSGRLPLSPIRGKNLEEKKSIKKLNSSAEVPKLRMDVEEESKVRHPSPIRRLSFSIGRIGRNSSSKDSCMPQNIYPTSEIGSGGAETSGLPVDSSCDKSNATSKARSSPLRRLLDPLLKPRAGNSDIPADSKQRPSAEIDMACKLSSGQGEASALHSVKVKLDLGSCKSIDIDHLRDLGKCGSTMVQALLQVAVKNGLPLFTFAVDNSSDILAATMRKLSSGRKDGNNLIFPFFVIHDMKKKKSGNWLSQGSKEKHHDYISDIVGQMKVSDVPTTVLTRQNSVDQCSIREFVLLATNTRQPDKQISDVLANDELAAIVVKLPKMTANPLNDCGPKKCCSRKLSTRDLKESPRDVCGCLDCRGVEGSGSSTGCIDLLGLTVILPGGDHGVPSKGKPSPLIERWKMGGSCDCGGWDLGCRLRVIASETQFGKGSSSRKLQSTSGKFHLYSQERVSERKPIFSLSPFKDGIYSVEFDSSIKILQAFSICIAVLNGLKPAEFSELSHSFEKKSSEETALPATDIAKVSNRDLEEIPASFIACPPGSPVARV